MKSLPAKYILYVAFGYFLCSTLYFYFFGYLSYLSSGGTGRETEYMMRLSLIALPFYALGLFCTYLRFEKNNLNATWGLTIAGAYLLFPMLVNLGNAFELLREGNIHFVIWLVQSFFYLLLWFVPLFVIFQTFLVDKSVLIGTKEKKEYKPSDEISDKDFLPTLILCFFVGMLGIHRFYAGKVGTGIAMIVTLGGLGIWVLVDFILICIGSFRDIDGRIIKYQRAVIATSSSETGIAEELEKFSVLKDKGIISEEEFNKKKEELLE